MIAVGCVTERSRYEGKRLRDVNSVLKSPTICIEEVRSGTWNSNLLNLQYTARHMEHYNQETFSHVPCPIRRPAHPDAVAASF